MKKIFLLHSRVGSLTQRLMVMSCVLMLGVMQVWGAPTTIASWGCASYSANTNYPSTGGDANNYSTKNDKAYFTTTKAFNTSATNAYYGSSSAGAVITFKNLNLSGYTGVTITFYSRASQQGTFQLAYSTNGGTSWDDGNSSGTLAKKNDPKSYSISFPANSTSINAIKLTHSASSGSLYFGTITISGNIPSITCATTNLTGFTYQEGSGASTAQSFTVSGANLANNITVSAPTNYEVSKSSGSGYASSVTLNQTSGSVSSTTIYVRLKAGLSAGTYNGSSITISSLPATSKTISLSGSVTSAVSCTANPSVGVASINGSISWTSSPKTVPFTVSSVGGGSDCTLSEYGFVWKQGSAPTISDNKTQIGTTSSATSFSGNVSGSFAVDQVYYVKAYAKNNGNNTALSSTGTTFTPRSVTFSLNGHGSGSAPATQYILDGEKATAPASNPTDDDYDFGGWYDNAACSDGHEWTFASKTVTGSSPTIYAKWTAKPALTSIAITGQPTTRAYLVGDVFSSAGATVTAYYDNSTSKTVTATWTPNTALSAGLNQTMTASYTERGVNKTATTTINVYSVTVNKVNMSTTAITNAGVTAGCTGRTLSQSVGSTNYKFNSYEVSAGGVTISNNSITGTPNADVVINAKFHNPITVEWKVGDGNASGGTTEVKYGAKVTALPTNPANNALAKCGTNVFKGWSKEEITETGHSAPSDLFTSTSDAGCTALTANTVYHAVFAKEEEGPTTSYAAITSGLAAGNYVIAYDYNGGTKIVLTNAKDGGTSDTQLEGEALSLSNNKYVTSDGKYIWTLQDQNDGSYYIYNAASEKYLNATTSALSMSTTPTKFVISYDGPNSRWTIKLKDSDTYYVHGYVSGTSYDFRVSTSGSGAKYHTYLYKNEMGTTTSDYMTNCCNELEDINGGVTWSDAATAVLTWDNLENVDGTTPYNVTYRTGSAAYGNTNVGLITTNDQGKRTCTITGLTPCANYDFMITANPVDGYCEKDQTINDSQTHAWGVSFPTLTGTTKKSGDATSCATGNYVATFEAVSAAYELPTSDGVTVTIGGSAATITTDYTWVVSEGVGTLTVLQASITGNIAISVVGVAHTCADDPDLGTASLSGTLNLTTVGVSCTGITPGSYCAVESEDYGFIWYAGTGDKVIGDEGVHEVAISTGDYSSGAFAAELSGTFNLGDTYTFRAFAENTGDKVGYSDAVSFKLRSVTFNKNNGEENVVVYVNNGSAVAQPSNPSKTGYEFSKWQKEGSDYDFESPVGSNITLDAIYNALSYDVTLKANGGSGDDKVVSATYGLAMPLTLKGGGDLTSHTKQGHTLLGYWDATSDGNKYYNYEAGTLSSAASWNKTSATDLYARWQANVYQVSLDNQGATVAGATSVQATYGQAMPSIAENLPSKTGYVFGGYFAETGGSGNKYYNANGTSANNYAKYSADPANHVLYAYWIPALTFVVNGEVSTIQEDNTAMPSSADVPAACGSCWEFIGWSTNADESGAPAYAGGATHQFGKPTRLYAVFGKTEYKAINSTDELINNDNYVIVARKGENVRQALSNAAHSYYDETDAAATDVANNTKDNAEGYSLYNVSPDVIWKFTGNAEEGQLYNAAEGKYINLSSQETSILSTTNDLTFEVDDYAWTIKSTYYLGGYSSQNGGYGFDAASETDFTDKRYHPFLYHQTSATYATEPGCAAYTVAWMKDGVAYSAGNPTISATQCEGVEAIPTAPADDALACSEKFMGWSESELFGTGKTAPADLFTSLANAPAITENKTFNAVFASEDTEHPIPTEKSMSITIDNFTEITTSYTTTFTHTYSVDNGRGNTNVSVDAYGVYKNNSGIQMNKGKSTYIKNTVAIPGAITKIEMTWTSAGNNSPTIYVAKDAEASTSSTSKGEMSNETTTHTINLDAEDGYNYFYFDGTTVTGACYMSELKITYVVDVPSYKDYVTSCCTPNAIVLSGVDAEEGKVFAADKAETCEGKTVTLSYTEDGHYTFDRWTVTKASSGTVTVTDNTFTMPDEAVTVTASWNAKPYSLTVVDPTNGNVTITGSDNSYGARDVDYMTEITLEAAPADDGHVFQSWTITPNNIGLDPTEPTLNFTMPGEAISFTANFGDVANSVLTLGESEIYTLTAVDNTTGQAIDLSSVKAGKSIKVSYTIDGQYEATGWTTTPTVVTNAVDNYVTFKMPAEDLTVDLNIQPYYLLNLSAVHGSINSVSINGVDQGEEIQSQYRVHENDVVALTASPEDETYKFVEWSGATVTNGQLTIGTSNVDLSAVFTAKDRFNLTLVTCGRTQQVINALEGTSIYSLVSAKTAPALTGYTFVGWSETENGEAISTKDLKLTADKSVYAVYSQNAYYEKVTSISEGQYLIVYEEEKIAFNGGLASLDAGRNKISVPLSNHKIAANTTIDAASFTIAEYDGGYSILSTKGKYIGRSAASKGLDVNDVETKNTITFGESGNAIIAGTGGYQLRYNSSSGSSNERFRYYSSTSQQDIHLYKKIVPEGNESNPSTVVANGEEFEIDAAMTLNNLTVEAGGKVSGSGALSVNDLTINTEAGKSGQVMDASKLNVTGELYLDVTLYTSTSGLIDADYWYSVAVPFDVDIYSGIYRLDGNIATQLHNSADFDVWYYDTEYRASSQRTGWKRLSGKMKAGKAYLIGFDDGMSNRVRFKAAEGWKDRLFTDDELSVVSTGGSGDHDNWNGLANPTMRYIDIDKDAQVFNNDSHQFDPFSYDAQAYNFVVGTAFFVQSASAVTISNDDHGQYRAPKRVDETKCAYAVRITREDAKDFDNQIIVRASEDATGTYTQGHDMLTMNGTSSNTAALLWTENYGGKRLAIEEAAWINGTATYELKMYAPKAGSYSISVAEAKDNADLYLTYEGSIIWNLSMGAYEIELTKGTTNGYGLLLQAKAPQVVTGVDEVDAETGVQKIIINEHVFILRGGQMYDVTGKAVK